MSYFQRIAAILDACKKASIRSRFQTNYGGEGRHRLDIVTDSVTCSNFVCYADAEDCEEKLIEIELFLGLVEEEESDKKDN